MGSREFYCTSCGLFYWMDKTTIKRGCPNDECVSNQQGNVSRIYGVSSMAFAYYYRNRVEEIRRIAWSSERFAPQSAIEHYKRQGMAIKP